MKVEVVILLNGREVGRLVARAKKGESPEIIYDPDCFGTYNENFPECQQCGRRNDCEKASADVDISDATDLMEAVSIIVGNGINKPDEVCRIIEKGSKFTLPERWKEKVKNLINLYSKDSKSILR